MKSVLNLFSGPYASTESISATLRAGERGVIDVDNDSVHGGGAAADITANTTFNFCISLVEGNIIIGGISAQNCSGGSLLRLRNDANDDSKPMAIMTQSYPDGVPDLPLKHQKELHVNDVVSYRTTHLFRLLFERGGWFLAECPGMRGDISMPVSYDPALSEHLSQIGTRHWKQLQADTKSVLITAAMCALYPDGAQKLEDFLISPNLFHSLGIKLQQLVCTHPIGTHAASLAGKAYGQLDAGPTKRWMPKLCTIIADGVAPITPTGGDSFQLGVDTISHLALKSMALQDASRWLRTAPAEARIATTAASLTDIAAAVAAAASHALSMPFECLPISLKNTLFTDADVHPFNYETVLSIVGSAGGIATINPYYVTRLTTFESPYMAFASTGEPADEDSAPQTDRALALRPDRALWEASDDEEIDTLRLKLGVIAEVIANGNERVWSLKIVRKFKRHAVTNKMKRRSRLVMVGTGHEEGKEFDAKSVATPMFPTVLIVMIKSIILKRTRFSFDLTQFFQLTDCNTPGGDLIGRPPKRFRKYTPEGREILWVFKKWLQGARGAGNAARKEFETLVMKNSSIPFSRSTWDPSLYIYHGPNDEDIEFTLHGDDGIGSASSEAAAAKLQKLLKDKYDDKIKWEREYSDVLGFAWKINDKTATITAPKHIAALEVFVKTDAKYFPSVPYTKDFIDLKPIDAPEYESPEWYVFDANVHYMQETAGHIAHILKIRPDCAGAHNMVIRTSHAPCNLAIKCMKHLLFYLLNTIDVGLTINIPDKPNIDMLIYTNAVAKDHILDTINNKMLQYHIVLDGALGTDRSISSILHMFGGIAISGQSFRQASMAISAHDTECFTASTGAAQSYPIRGILQELKILQIHPSPIFSDSASTRLVANYEAALKRSIYIARRILYMREGVSENEYSFHQCIGATNPSDPNTKVVSRILFLAARLYFMGV